MEYLSIALGLGCTYALIALGYALIFSCLRVINFAHGEFCTAGAYAAFWLVQTTGFPGWMAVGMAAVCTAGVAVVTWSLAYRPIKSTDRSSTILAALGASMVLQQLYGRIFGTQSRAFPHVITSYDFAVGPFKLQGPSVVIVFAAVGLFLLVHVFWSRSRLGVLVRAVADDVECAEAAGIRTKAVFVLVFGLAGAAAGLAGVFLGESFGRVEPTLGFGPGLKAFVAALVGGVHDPRKAALGGLLLGVAETAAIAFGLSAFRDAIVLLGLVCFLIGRAYWNSRSRVIGRWSWEQE